MKGTQEEEIVLCLILDSRQNYGFGKVSLADIVLCLILDSRQNRLAALARFLEDCTVPYFGFKAKHIVLI